MPDIARYPHDVLPMPLQEGYGFTPVSPLMRTEMQSGRAKQRRRYKTPTEVPVAWVFKTDAQAQLFESWYADAIADGALWFEMTLQTPQGVLPYKCRFIEIYDGPLLVGGRYWRFTATLELWERPVLKGGWGLYYPDAVRYMDIIDLALNQKWPESPYQTHMAALDLSVNKEWTEA